MNTVHKHLKAYHVRLKTGKEQICEVYSIKDIYNLYGANNLSSINLIGLISEKILLSGGVR